MSFGVKHQGRWDEPRDDGGQVLQCVLVGTCVGSQKDGENKTAAHSRCAQLNLAASLDSAASAFSAYTASDCVSRKSDAYKLSLGAYVAGTEF